MAPTGSAPTLNLKQKLTDRWHSHCNSAFFFNFTGEKASQNSELLFYNKIVTLVS